MLKIVQVGSPIPFIVYSYESRWIYIEWKDCYHTLIESNSTLLKSLTIPFIWDLNFRPLPVGPEDIKIYIYLDALGGFASWVCY